MSKTKLIPLIIDGDRIDGAYECTNCKHRILWPEKDLDKLRFCWYCGEQFITDELEGEDEAAVYDR